MVDANSNQQQIDDLLEKDIIELLGLEHLEENQKKDLRAKIMKTVENRVILRLNEELKEKNLLEEFEKITDEAEIRKFLANHDINTDQMFLEEALLLKTQLKTSADYIDLGFQVKPANN